MFHRRPKEFDNRISTIASHLRAIEQELGDIGQNAGRRASAGTSGAVSQIADAISPVLTEIEDWLRTGRRMATDEAGNLSNEALRIGSKIGGDALDRITSEAKSRPVVTLAVAIGVGILIGIAARRG